MPQVIYRYLSILHYKLNVLCIFRRFCVAVYFDSFLSVAVGYWFNANFAWRLWPAGTDAMQNKKTHSFFRFRFFFFLLYSLVFLQPWLQFFYASAFAPGAFAPKLERRKTHVLNFIGSAINSSRKVIRNSPRCEVRLELHFHPKNACKNGVLK